MLPLIIANHPGSFADQGRATVYPTISTLRPRLHIHNCFFSGDLEQDILSYPWSIMRLNYLFAHLVVVLGVLSTSDLVSASHHIHNTLSNLFTPNTETFQDRTYLQGQILYILSDSTMQAWNTTKTIYKDIQVAYEYT